jgi:molybdenum cofactor biosynthesis enzyme MoaA
VDILNNTVCVYPWINLHTNTDGRCKLCCHIYSEDYININGKAAVLGKDNWEEIWNGEHMQEVRNRMIAGSPLKECNRCYEHEQKGLESSRQWANKTYAMPSSTDVYNPTHLELRLGNHCNLKCNSCWSVSSDTIYKERKKIMANEQVPDWLANQWNHEIRSVENFDWQWFETDEFRRFVDSVAPTLKRLYLTGGEPTLIDANLYIINKLVEVGNKDCYVSWTTNMTTWPLEFYNKLEFFNESEIQMSIDGYGIRNSYIRYPTDWKKVEQNFSLAQQLPANVHLKIYFVYQAWNVFDVGDLIGWLESKQGDRRVDFVPIFLEHPEQIHSCVWPDHVKLRVLEKLHNLTTLRHQDAVSRIINYTVNTDKYNKSNIDKMKQFISINDKYRKYKFENIFPEFKEALEPQ